MQSCRYTHTNSMQICCYAYAICCYAHTNSMEICRYAHTNSMQICCYAHTNSMQICCYHTPTVCKFVAITHQQYANLLLSHTNSMQICRYAHTNSMHLSPGFYPPPPPPPNVPASPPKDFVNDFFLIPPMHQHFFLYRGQLYDTTKTRKCIFIRNESITSLRALFAKSSRSEWAGPNIESKTHSV